MATIANDAAKVTLAEAAEGRFALHITNRSPERLAVHLNAAEPAFHVLPYEKAEVPSSYAGPVQGSWDQVGPGVAVVHEIVLPE